MTHELKTWVEYYQAVCNGEKTFEVRKDDRNFNVGDYLHLREWDNVNEVYTKNWTMCIVTYKLNGGSFGIESGHCVLGIQLI